MAYKGVEIRECERFEVIGTTISYKQRKHIFSKKKHGEESCPIIDISRGGVRFVCDKALKINRKISLEIFFPDSAPVFLKGRVRWSAINPGRSYKYQSGVQFDPFGKKKGLNDPRILVKIIKLEKKFLTK